MKQHERSMMAKKSEAGGVGTMDPLKSPGTEDQEMGAEDPHQVMQEHGPATHTMTEHPPEGQEGGHMAHSMHPDGHEHHSEHKDGKSAHEHAMCLSGHCEHGEQGGEQEQEPEAEYD
jgi:hypothetical protein